MEASGPHHYVSHVDIFDFNVSHLIIASSQSWRLTLEAGKPHHDVFHVDIIGL